MIYFVSSLNDLFVHDGWSIKMCKWKILVNIRTLYLLYKINNPRVLKYVNGKYW